MNFAQFGLFAVFFFAVLAAGFGIRSLLQKKADFSMGRLLFVAENILLGLIFITAQLLILSLVGLYKGGYLWAAVLLNYLFLFRFDTRHLLRCLFAGKFRFAFSGFIVVLLLLIFIFRNLYFLIDVDDFAYYLFTQRIWLLAGTSLVGDIGKSFTFFFPQADAVFYSLGLSAFPLETLFPSLVHLLWKLIALSLVFGYTAYRFNRWYGLAAILFILFNGHFFYSGINRWVTINAAVIAYLFASLINFWEARIKANSFRLLLALVFLMQLTASRYQMLYVSVFILVLGVLVQPSLRKSLSEILHNRRWQAMLLISLFVVFFWYLKNLLITGDPLYPAFAGRLGVFNWTLEHELVMTKVFGGLDLEKFIKFMNFLFIWPGVNPAKIVIVVISFFPVILLGVFLRHKKFPIILLELCFWLTMCVLVVLGMCLISHQDPRYYRYPIGIFAFVSVFSLDFILNYCFNIKRAVIKGSIILLVSLAGFNTIYESRGYFHKPTFSENMGVLSNRIHTDYAIKKSYPNVEAILQGLENNQEKLAESAWDMVAFNYNVPQFILPDRPVASLWYNALVKWDSYSSQALVKKDLQDTGIKWLMRVRDGKLIFISIDEYASEAVKFERYPKENFYDYNLPGELREINYLGRSQCRQNTNLNFRIFCLIFIGYWLHLFILYGG